MCVFLSLGARAAAGCRCCVSLGAWVQGAAAGCAWVVVPLQGATTLLLQCASAAAAR